jgi:hypothetical protein
LDEVFFAENGSAAQRFMGGVLAEEAIEVASIEEDGKVVAFFLCTFAEPGSAAVCRERVQIGMDQGRMVGENSLKLSVYIFTQATIPSFA